MKAGFCKFALLLAIGGIGFSQAAFADLSPFYSPESFYNRPSYEEAPIISLDMDPKDIINTSFRIAAREDRVSDMEKFIQQGAAIDSKSGEGITALMYGAMNCSEKVVRYLVDAKADPNIQDNKGRTALMLAAKGSCPSVVRLLLTSAGVNLHLRDREGRSALDYALEDSLSEVGGPVFETIRLLKKGRVRLSHKS